MVWHAHFSKDRDFSNLKKKITMKVLILSTKNWCGLNYLFDMPIFQKSVIFPSWRLSWNFWTLFGEFRRISIVILWSFCFENISTFYCLFLRSNTLVSYFKHDLPFDPNLQPEFLTLRANLNFSNMNIWPGNAHIRS